MPMMLLIIAGLLALGLGSYCHAIVRLKRRQQPVTPDVARLSAAEYAAMQPDEAASEADRWD